MRRRTGDRAGRRLQAEPSFPVPSFAVILRATLLPPHLFPCPRSYFYTSSYLKSVSCGRAPHKKFRSTHETANSCLLFFPPRHFFSENAPRQRQLNALPTQRLYIYIYIYRCKIIISRFSLKDKIFSLMLEKQKNRDYCTDTNSSLCICVKSNEDKYVLQEPNISARVRKKCSEDEQDTLSRAQRQIYSLSRAKC